MEGRIQQQIVEAGAAAGVRPDPNIASRIAILHVTDSYAMAESGQICDVVVRPPQPKTSAKKVASLDQLDHSTIFG
jgi:hypothetical protein